eukprot:GHVP01045413.1.p2 GENE.GHVP01045413.1~~GHVP01045413.1.p2  ORF type:complete len:104 (-),score=13.05 GHVP01045413.1:175-441(-)
MGYIVDSYFLEKIGCWSIDNIQIANQSRKAFLCAKISPLSGKMESQSCTSLSEKPERKEGRKFSFRNFSAFSSNVPTEKKGENWCLSL